MWQSKPDEDYSSEFRFREFTQESETDGINQPFCFAAAIAWDNRITPQIEHG
ncbi:hypothetical protein [Rhizobium mesosinicum]|uniref:Uncharacterized protein n=1 Tax=Rhizobium mesosinicum TaxID=335017 RepID=A0ABS7GMD9_9HYPH|nr:hypothetical protein [Rhizobium mesosinicum]MBW9051143.1 hypothetical protein [Rhizobium mesosinicum]